MTTRKVTLHDVAKAAGVHISTASRALNSETRHVITPEVADRVRATARSLGYRANAIASGLRSRRTRAVGVVIPDILNAVFPPILLGVEQTLREAGYGIAIASEGKGRTARAEALDGLLARQVDGIITATAHLDDPTVLEIVRRGVPVVMVNRRDRRSRVPSVVTDDERGIAQAVEHLIGLGHKRIAHVAGPQDLSTGVTRLRGFTGTLASHGIEIPASFVRAATGYGREAGAEAAAPLLAQRPPPTAIVAANDLLALGCYDALRAAGLRCPDDVSVTGYNDMPLVDLVAPPLTTVRIQHHEMGAEAARLLLRRLADSAVPDVDVVLRAELVVRGSTAPPRKAPRNSRG